MDPSDSADYNLSDDDLSDVNSGYEGKLLTLLEMGFNIDEASAAITRCGPDASLLEITDSISAAQTAKDYDDFLSRPPNTTEVEAGRKRQAKNHSYNHKKRRLTEKASQLKKESNKYSCNECFNRRISCGEEHSIFVPNLMVGFSLPNDSRHPTKRKLPEAVIGPPYFY